MYFTIKFVIPLLGFLSISCKADISSCESLPNGSLLPHPSDCHRFIICMNGNPIEVNCPENNLFVKTSNGCVPSPINDCPTGETPPSNIRCPENTIELLPYPNDCGKFLQCINEHINVYKCPNGLHWNQITKHCEKPENANCISETPPLCDPNEDPMYPTHLPHPTDCTKFYKCEGGFGHIMSCPPGLHWSIYTDRCEYPAVAQCDKNNGTNPPGVCPENDDPFNPTHLPYPADCSKFIKCESSTPHIMDCPPGQHWNAAQSYCDYPENAKCTPEKLNSNSSFEKEDVDKPIPHKDCPRNEDPSDPTQLPYPNDCTKFYKCLDGMAYPINCPPNLHWSIELNRCDWPHFAKCKTSDPPESAIPHPSCPPNENPANPTQLPYPNDCTKFYKCLKGYAYPMDCPAGLHWSVEKNWCDWPDLAKCENKIKKRSIESFLNMKCPKVDDPLHIVRLPNPDDCGLYYECSHGTANLQLCPPGTHWCVRLQRCTFPELAGCDPTLKPHVPFIRPAFADIVLETENVNYRGDPIKHELCPPDENPENPTQLPYPNDCTKFYKCLKGYAYPMDCPAGLHWSVEKNWCDWPDLAKCENKIKKRSIESSLNAKCPKVDDPLHIVRLPNPDDCGLYYECSHGIANLQLCPPGTHWCVRLQQCTFPEFAGCDPTLKPHVPFIRPAFADIVLQSENLNRGGPIKHKLCPPDENPENPTQLLYPNDCTKFYKCLKGYAYPMDCPAALHWSVELNRCEWPDVAKCDKNMPHIPTEVVKQSCPPNENSANPTQLPYPNDCTKFYKCLNGVAYSQKCPSGLEWSIQFNRCDWPDVAECKLIKE